MNGQKVMRTIYRFSLPFSVTLPKKTIADEVCYLNMNAWRTMNHFKIAKCKKLFKPLPGYLPFKAMSVRISYEIIKRRSTDYDVMNIVSPVDKCFCDWLVRKGMLSDDHCYCVQYGHMIGTHGVVDRIYAYVEVLK